MYDSRMIANETIAERLIRLAKAKFGDAHGFRRRLSESSGISESPLSKILGGSTRPTLPTLRKLAQALDVTLLSLTDPDAVPASTPTPEPLPFRVPLCGVVAAGLGEDEEFPPDLWLDVPGECRGANAAYQVRGLSMREVGILDGDYLFVRTNPEPDHGAIVVAWLQDRGNVVKRLERKGKKCVLHSEDGAVSPRWPYTMIDGDKFWGQLIATFRRYQIKPKSKKK